MPGAATYELMEPSVTMEPLPKLRVPFLVISASGTLHNVSLNPDKSAHTLITAVLGVTASTKPLKFYIFEPRVDVSTLDH